MPCMSKVMIIVALPCLLVRTFMDVISICRSVKTFEISANIPMRLLAKILISVEYRSPLVPSSGTCHSASISLLLSSSGRFRILMQSVL